MKLICHNRSRAAFTLLELVVSAAVGALILTAAAICLNAAVESQRMINPRVDTIQTARVALAMMSADLRAACPLDKNYDFLGSHRSLGDMDADNIDFATHNYSPRHPREADFCEMSYFIDKSETNGQYGLWRRRNPTLAQDPLSGGSREEIAPDVRGLRIEYYDGLDWYDTWGDLNGRRRNSTTPPPNLVGMPSAVRITLSFDSSPATKSAPDEQEMTPTNRSPMVFQTVVYLELAAKAAASDSTTPTPATLSNAPPGTASPSL
jgi:type II secretory pathway component PulJ